MKTLFARRSVLALAMATGMAASPAFAADQKDTVVANVNGSDVKLSSMADFARQMGPQAAQAPYEVMLEVVINNQLVYDAAKKDKMDADPEVKAALRKVEAQLITQAYMQKKMRSAISEEAIKARYDQAVKEFVPAEEVRARHILVDTEEAARSIIAELGRGSDFAELAKTRSKDTGSGMGGGDLGYFTQKDMVPEFASAAFAMRPGEVSKAPVKSQFGFHVIKVEDKRMATIPPFEQAKPAIANKIAEDIQQKVVMDLRDKAKIKRFNVNGTPMAEPAKK
ncbi:parvulin peptidyl-prolyl isomerase [Paramagnetospirillum kuznetsovii]|uniref:Parvulin-like PPIase n=1 Tax=Paramagnetospirillum kuznetsovii TaxID=2053833 RepID=A0A364NUA0_9PROT|nr:peptidylprolyl isomerase [Paramagnetospirillum kuznetsovii]RAU20646.1 parvulin peptidyl-prolyl isomerase [Paramagnetospirillum kuznetsovii]